MKKILYIVLLFPIMAIGQTQTENYIRSNTYKVATSTTIAIPTVSQANQSITYFDGLGRPIQQIAHQQATSGNDIVTPIEYDVFGRQTKDYLPYAPISTASLNYKSNALTEVGTFYNTVVYENTLNPYSEKLFEASPLNRILKQAAPGNDWALGSNHEIRLDYQTNTSSDTVKLFNISSVWDSSKGLYDIPTSLTTANFADYQLYKTITKNENWTSGNNNTTEEYKDKEGKVILKRTYESSLTHNTYYIYDQYSNLTFVIPPKVDTSNIISTTILDGLCYQYKYDYRNRLVEKKIPGKQWEFIVYDKLDRVVASGPALSPFSDLQTTPPTIPIVGWMITKYDIFNRPVYTGWQQSSTVTSAGRKTLQDAQNALTTTINEIKTAGITSIDGINTNYSNVVAPTSFKLLSVNYYDDYSFPDAPTGFGTVLSDNSGIVYYNNSTNKPKDLPTGSWVRIPELSTTSPVRSELSYTLYDDKARPIRTKTTNYLTGYTQVDSKLDFIGKTLYSETTHKRLATDANEIYVKDSYTYTNQDKVLAHIHQIGTTGTPQLLAKNTYNELGQLISKNVGGTDITGATSLQKVDYSYNIRGWMTGINKVDGSPNPLQQGTDPLDLFAFKINYNTVQNETNYIGKPLYNGNISETYWKTSSDNTLRKYGYFYDNLSRLNNAVYQKPGNTVAVTNSYNESLGYDKNGNITNLSRNGVYEDNVVQLTTDNLNYFYATNSNTLMKVTDITNNTTGFKDDSNGTNDTVDDYSYDTNGNMTKDDNKKIISIKYNHLNLPAEIVFTGTNKKINYIYNANGTKKQKMVINGTVVTTTDYLDGFQYTKTGSGSVVLNFFPNAEGYVTVSTSAGVSSYNYVYNYTDHLGNVRLSYGYGLSGGIYGTYILQENNYYPFGLRHSGYNINKYDYDISNTGDGAIIINTTSLDYLNKYKYNGKEWQDELGLNVTAMDFRQYDPAIGRFNSMDELAEEDPDFTPYRFAYDNPNYWNDPSGLSEVGNNGSNNITGWVNQGGKTFWDPKVNNAGDVKRFYGDTATYVPDNTVTPNGDGTSTQYNPDGTKTTILKEVTVTSTPKPKSESPGFSPWGPTLIGLGQPLKFLKPVGALGSSEGSSIASWTLSKAIPYSSPLLKQTTRKVAARFIGRQAAKKVGTAVVGRFLGRLVPYVGWGLFANDIYQNRAEIKQWAKEQQVQNAENKYNDDGTWNAGFGGSSCFVKGTLVYGKNEYITIEKIKVGDSIYSYNIEKHKLELSKVINTLNRMSKGIYEIKAGLETINVTAEHPIYVDKKGWIKVKDLKVGDILKSLDGKIKIEITSIKELDKVVVVYNIEVDGNHNYFITNSTILVHNKNITNIKSSQSNCSPKKTKCNE